MHAGVPCAAPHLARRAVRAAAAAAGHAPDCDSETAPLKPAQRASGCAPTCGIAASPGRPHRGFSRRVASGLGELSLAGVATRLIFCASPHLQLLLADHAPPASERWRPNPLHTHARQGAAAAAAAAPPRSPIHERRSSLGSAVSPRLVQQAAAAAASSPSSSTPSGMGRRARSLTTAEDSSGSGDDDDDQDEDEGEAGDSLGDLRPLALRSAGAVGSSRRRPMASQRSRSLGGVAAATRQRQPRRLSAGDQRRQAQPLSRTAPVSAFDATAASSADGRVASPVVLAASRRPPRSCSGPDTADGAALLPQPPSIPVPPAVRSLRVAAASPTGGGAEAASAQSVTLWRHEAALASLLSLPVDSSSAATPRGAPAVDASILPVATLLGADWGRLRLVCREYGFWPGLVQAAVQHVKALTTQRAASRLRAATVPSGQLSSLRADEAAADAEAEAALRDAIGVAVHYDDMPGWAAMFEAALSLARLLPSSAAAASPTRCGSSGASSPDTPLEAVVTKVLALTAAALAARDAADSALRGDIPPQGLPLLRHRLSHASVLGAVQAAVPPLAAARALQQPAAAAFVPHVTLEWCARGVLLQRAAVEAWEQAAAVAGVMAEYDARSRDGVTARAAAASATAARLPSVIRPLDARLAEYGISLPHVVGTSSSSSSSSSDAAKLPPPPSQPLEDPLFTPSLPGQWGDASARQAAWMALQGSSAWLAVAVPSASPSDAAVQRRQEPPGRSAGGRPRLGSSAPSTTPEVSPSPGSQGAPPSAEAVSGGLVSAVRLRALLQKEREAALLPGQQQRLSAAAAAAGLSATSSSARLLQLDAASSGPTRPGGASSRSIADASAGGESTRRRGDGDARPGLAGTRRPGGAAPPATVASDRPSVRRGASGRPQQAPVSSGGAASRGGRGGGGASGGSLMDGW